MSSTQTQKIAYDILSLLWQNKVETAFFEFHYHCRRWRENALYLLNQVQEMNIEYCDQAVNQDIWISFIQKVVTAVYDE